MPSPRYHQDQDAVAEAEYVEDGDAGTGAGELERSSDPRIVPEPSSSPFCCKAASTIPCNSSFLWPYGNSKQILSFRNYATCVCSGNSNYCSSEIFVKLSISVTSLGTSS